MSQIERFEIRANWSARRTSVNEFALSVHELVQRFRGLHASLSDWALLTNEEPWFAPLDCNAETLLSLVVKTNFDDDIQRKAAEAVPASVLNTTNFRVHLVCTSAGQQPSDAPEQGGLHLEVASGATVLAVDPKGVWFPQNQIEAERVRVRSRAHALLKLPADHYGVLHEPELVRSLLDAMVHTWHPSRCVVGSFEFLRHAFGMDAFGRQIGVAGGSRKLWQGWITYLKLRGLPAFLPAYIDCETLSDEAAFLFTTRDRPDAEDQQQLASARRIDGALSDLRLNQEKVVMDGRPHDPLEIDYGKQVTRIPSNRVYRVALADFTAYDGERQVLIDAKLLRSEAVADIELAMNDKFIEGTRLGAEALHQLRSLDLVGSTTKVEWHIGREDIVEPLRCLLHRRIGIPERRLEVVYTPYLQAPRRKVRS